MLPAPKMPSPPALLTALAKRQPLAQIMPAWMMGRSIWKSCVILLENADIWAIKIVNEVAIYCKPNGAAANAGKRVLGPTTFVGMFNA